MRYRVSCAAAVAAAQFFAALVLTAPAAAQAVPRIKAKLLAFDGQMMSLEPLTPLKTLPSPSGANDAAPKNATDKTPLQVALLPDTRFVVTQASSFAVLKAGDYAGAMVTQSRNGRLRAQQVYLYARALRGSGEGRFPDGDALRINGAISLVTPTSAQDNQDGSITLHYRGALVSPAGAGRTVCEGRASPPALASALACAADAVIEVPSGTPVAFLAIGDKSLLVPGALLSVALDKNEAGATVTPGVVVEKPAEKPQSSP